MNSRGKHRLTVVPMGGLGNRMRVIRSAYIVAQSEDWAVDVAFAENAECHCRFADVFQPIASPCGNFCIRAARFLDEFPSRRNLRLPHLLRSLAYRRQLYNYSSPDRATAQSYLQHSLPAYIATCYEFAGESIAMQQLFRPSAEVERRTDEIARRFGSYTVGMHIRATDNIEALRRSPYRLFAEAARRELGSNPQAVFLVATDDDGIRSQFIADFGEKAITSPYTPSRSTTEGMLNATAEMFALSRCTKIYGSHNSSFSEIAAELGGKQAEILKT